MNTPALRSGPLALDPDHYAAQLDGEPFGLNGREFDLIHYLALNAGRVMRREEIMWDVWDQELIGSCRTVDVHVYRLRVKLGDRRDLIRTVRGRGYMWVGEVEPATTGRGERPPESELQRRLDAILLLHLRGDDGNCEACYAASPCPTVRLADGGT